MMNEKWQYSTLVALIILMFPYFAIIQYVHPQGDDFFLLMMRNKMGAINLIAEMYETWSGRYFALLLGSINPSNNIMLFKVYLAIFQLTFLSSIFLLIKSLFNKSFSNIYIINITLASYLIFANALPFLFEFQYWYPSVTAYQFSLSLLILLWSIYLFKEQNQLKDTVYIFLSIILIILIIGLNELMIAPLFISIAIQFYKDFKSGKNKLQISLLIITFLIAIAINILAPGNYVRLPKIGNEFNLLNTLLITIQSELFVIGSFIQNASFIFSSILLVLISGKYINQEILSFRIIKIHPLKYSFISFILLFIFILPSTIILGHLPPGRVLNLISFFFFIMWIYGILIFVNYYPTVRNFVKPKYLTGVFSFLIVFFMFNTIFVVNRFEFGFGEKRKAIYLYGNELTAWNTFIFEGAKYDSDVNNRNMLYKEAQKQNRSTISVPPIKHSPKLLMFQTFFNSQKEGTWYWDAETQYYKLDSIYIESK